MSHDRLPTQQPSSAPAEIPELLHAAVEAVGGVPRSGQEQMAEAVAAALRVGEHLLVQAGTGTGKSLAYLVPALAHHGRSVIATATLALQRQLVERDLPRTVTALHPALRRRPEFAMLKGRSNYVCLHRVHEGTPSDEEEGLFDAAEAVGGPTGKLGRDVVRITEWSEETETGDRDDLTPGVSDRAWAQLSVSSRECLGASRCPYGAECFAELARERAKLADVVVTNHALLAIDALEDAPILPEHDLLVVDEAHELVSRVTNVATAELAPWTVTRAARRAAKMVDQKVADDLEAAAENFAGVMELAPEGRTELLTEALAHAVALIRDACRRGITALGDTRDKSVQGEDAVRKQALASMDTAHRTAERLLEANPYDVLWVHRGERFGASLHVAPLSVSGLLRERLFSERTVVLTSATLKLGGDFGGVAGSLGLDSAHRLPDELPPPARESQPQPQSEADLDEQPDDAPPHWRGLDVGSPFDYPKQGILYVARHLSPPNRDPARPDMLDELAELIEAAGGRTLGLFSSMRAAVTAAEELRERLGMPILLQGEDTLGELIRAFAADAETCLFGTLSLWQGVDVPGSACQLVVLDKIPFPRPDDPLMSARQKAVEEAGGNGFMAVAANHAALLMAQGSGRLIRSSEDRGVVAVLDPRLATARYGSYLRQSMPPFWFTADRNQARRSLAAVAASAPPPRPVPERG